ncbi:MAG: hypothetical protein EU981_03550 [Candidatus Liberibacter ctenarytainae]|uniref:Uncharacterized protein n=1 Tax=Candidatus Liberibacter ctenarytainae TaxID=2020335 RepID=A0A937ALU8_9HYPH|nr:hypothetical protein [Candidatus Liberibacter ctenarytainae]
MKIKIELIASIIAIKTYLMTKIKLWTAEKSLKIMGKIMIMVHIRIYGTAMMGFSSTHYVIAYDG